MVEARNSSSRQQPKKKKDGCCSSKPKQVPQEEITEVINQIEEKKDFDPGVRSVKVIFMGDKSVGKTSIIRTFIQGKCQKNEPPTKLMGDFQKLIQVNDGGQRHQIKLKIWDAAGEGEVSNLAHLFVRDVQVGVLVYSINSRASFNHLDDWLDHIKEQNEDFLLFLVGNKSDLVSHRDVPTTIGA